MLSFYYDFMIIELVVLYKEFIEIGNKNKWRKKRFNIILLIIDNFMYIFR